MIKIVGTWKRNPSLSEEQVETHYRTVHTALARRALAKVPGLRKYVQNKVLSTVAYYPNEDAPRATEPDFDRMVEIWFDKAEDMGAAFDTPEMRACLEDQHNFMDVTVPAFNKVYTVEEVVALKRDEYTGQICYPWTPADEKPFKEKFEKALAAKSTVR